MQNCRTWAILDQQMTTVTRVHSIPSYMYLLQVHVHVWHKLTWDLSRRCSSVNLRASPCLPLDTTAVHVHNLKHYQQSITYYLYMYTLTRGTTNGAHGSKTLLIQFKHFIRGSKTFITNRVFKYHTLSWRLSEVPLYIGTLHLSRLLSIYVH